MEGIVIGNFTGNQGGAFPVDTGTFEALQHNILSLMAMAAIGGVNYIVSGCELNAAGTMRNAGWLFLRTAQHPTGELVYFTGGSTAIGFYLHEEVEQVVANGVTYNAYTTRVAKPGSGREQWSWATIREIKSNAALGSLIEVVRNEANPIGTIRMFAGDSSNIPEGWLACDGSDYAQEEYSALYSVIGELYNGGDTADGRFRVPNLAERFAKHGSTPGTTGGVSELLFHAAYLPPHAHEVRDYYLTTSTPTYPQLNVMERISDESTTGVETGVPGDNGTHGAYYEHYTGKGIYNGREMLQQVAMPINPAYVEVTYIIRAK